VDLSDDVGIHGPYQFCLIAFAEFVVGRKTSLLGLSSGPFQYCLNADRPRSKERGSQ
jgi:hypothetical protein